MVDSIVPAQALIGRASVSLTRPVRQVVVTPSRGTVVAQLRVGRNQVANERELQPNRQQERCGQQWRPPLRFRCRLRFSPKETAGSRDLPPSATAYESSSQEIPARRCPPAPRTKPRPDGPANRRCRDDTERSRTAREQTERSPGNTASPKGSLPAGSARTTRAARSELIGRLLPDYQVPSFSCFRSRYQEPRRWSWTHAMLESEWFLAILATAVGLPR